MEGKTVVGVSSCILECFFSVTSFCVFDVMFFSESTRPSGGGAAVFSRVLSWDDEDSILYSTSLSIFLRNNMMRVDTNVVRKSENTAKDQGTLP